MTQPKRSPSSGRRPPAAKRSSPTGRDAGPKTTSSSSSRPAPGRPARTASSPRAARGRTAEPARTTPSPAPEAADTGDEGAAAAFRDLLTRVVDPLNLVMLTRDRIQETVDDAVERGHLTRSAANDIVGELVRRGRREVEDVLQDVDQLVGRVRTVPGGDRALQQVDRARRAVGVGPSFPILGYDDLAARDITGRLDDLTPAELRKVRDYERRHGNRKSVLAAVEKQLQQG